MQSSPWSSAVRIARGAESTHARPGRLRRLRISRWSEASICWRQLDAHLWAGRALDRPVGTIERRRDFVFIDLDGNQFGGYSSLAGAQEAAEHSHGSWPAPPRAHRFLASFASALVLAGLGAALLAVVVAIVAQGMTL